MAKPHDYNRNIGDLSFEISNKFWPLWLMAPVIDTQDESTDQNYFLSFTIFQRRGGKPIFILNWHIVA